MEIRMAAKDDCGIWRKEGSQRIIDIALQAVHKGTGNGNWSVGKGPNWNAKGYPGGKGDQDANRGGTNSWQKGCSKNRGKGQEKGGKGDSRTCRTCGKTRHIAAWCQKGGNKHLYASGEDESETIEETLDNDEELQAWCLLEKKAKISSGKRLSADETNTR